VEFGSGAYFYFIHLCGNGDASSRNMFAILFAIFNVCFATLLLGVFVFLSPGPWAVGCGKKALWQKLHRLPVERSSFSRSLLSPDDKHSSVSRLGFWEIITKAAGQSLFSKR